ncbi:MAG: serine hydrolase [Blautia sp.]|nr:serine hydrolase [Blautia sp.]
MTKEKRLRSLPAKALLLAVLLLLSGVFFYRPASAAVKNDATHLLLNDGSGSYLLRKNSSWYLRSSSGKALTGVHYLKIPTRGKLYTGCYMFDKNGKLATKKAVYHFDHVKTAVHTFNGYYYNFSGSGRFFTGEQGFRKLNTKYGSTNFKGFFYIGKYGQIKAPAKVWYLDSAQAAKLKIAGGWYRLSNLGRISTAASVVSLDCTVNDRVFQGLYAFAGKNASLLSREGWVTVSGKKYYADNTGKVLTDCWKDGYYLQSDGTIARSRQVPDGTYVDYNGRKCAKNEMRLMPLKNTLASMTSGYPNSWSVYVKDLKTGDTLLLNNKSMYAASTIKAFCMACVYDQVNKGKIKLTDTIKNRIWNLITVSSNDAFNALVLTTLGGGNWKKGCQVMNEYLKAGGYSGSACHSSVHPSSYSSRNDGLGRNQVSAKDAGILLERIYNGTCVNKTYSDIMLNTLLHQTRRSKIPAGVPSGIKVANKTGETSSVQHDMAIVYGKKTTYVIAVFSTCGSGASYIKKISKVVYDYLNK